MKRSKKTKAKDAGDLSSHISDRAELIRRVFLVLKPSEIKAMAPKFAKKLPLENLRALCLEEVTNMSALSLHTILSAPTAQDNTILIDSDSDTDDPLTASSDSEASNSDSSQTDESDGKVVNSDDDVMVIVDDSDTDIKSDFLITNEERVTDLGKQCASKINETKTFTHSNNGNDSQADQYVDKINRLDILTAKLDKEIDKLKKTTSQDVTIEYVNEMVSELTSIESEMSTKRIQQRRMESAHVNATSSAIENFNFHIGNNDNKRKREDIQSKRRLSKVLNNSESDGQEVKDKTFKQSGKATMIYSKSTQAKTPKACSSNSTVSRVSDKTNDNVEETVCLLSDSDDSQDVLESELQKSINESRKVNVLSKETAKINNEIKGVCNRIRPFSEEDIEIEIVVNGGPNQENRDKDFRRAVMTSKTKSKKKNTDLSKNYFKTTSETIVNDMLKQIDSAKTKLPDNDSADQITILSSPGVDNSDSDGNLPAREEGEIDSASDDSESHKSKKRKKRSIRKTSKKVNKSDVIDEEHNKVIENTSVDNNNISMQPINNELTEQTDEHATPQIRSTIVKVKDNDGLAETNCNKIKSVAVKVPQTNDNIKITVGNSNIKSRVVLNENITTYAKGKEIDSITVVVKNSSENDANDINRTVKMTEDIRSLESVVVAVKNKDRSSKINVAENKQHSSKNTIDLLKPVERKCIAKASDFVFVNPKDHGKPILMAREASVKTQIANGAKPSDPTAANKCSKLDNKSPDITGKTLYNHLSDLDMSDDIIELTASDADLSMDQSTIVKQSTIVTDGETAKTLSELKSDNIEADKIVDYVMNKEKTDNVMLSKAIEENITMASADIVLCVEENVTDVLKHDTMTANIVEDSNCRALTSTEFRLIHNMTPLIDNIELPCDKLYPAMIHELASNNVQPIIADISDSATSLEVEESNKVVLAIKLTDTIATATKDFCTETADIETNVSNNEEYGNVESRVRAAETHISKVKDSKRIDLDETVTTQNWVEEMTSDKVNHAVNVGDRQQYNKPTVYNNFQPLKYIKDTAKPLEYLKDNVAVMFINEVEEKPKTAIDFETQLDNVSPTEVTSLDPKSLLKPYKPRTVEELLASDQANSVDETKAYELHQINRCLEEGESMSTSEPLHPTHDTLEDGEIETAAESASETLEDGEVTDPSSSDVESVEIPNEIICISDEELSLDTGKIGLYTENITKKKEKKRKKQKKHKKCNHKNRKLVDCKEKSKLPGAKEANSKDITHFTSLDKDSTYRKNLLKVKDTNTISEVHTKSSFIHEVKYIEAISDSEITKINAQTTSANTEISRYYIKNTRVVKDDLRDMISDSSDVEITEDVETEKKKSSTSKMSTDTLSTDKDPSQNVIDMLSIEISSDESSDEPIFEDLDVLSATIDGIENQQVAKQHQSEQEGDIENISWHDRYLDSKKVRKVLSTSNILNALRKKNRELKKKMLESKQAENCREKSPEPQPVEVNLEINIEEGSIEHYNTLQGSTKFVDPRSDPTDTKDTDSRTNAEDISNEQTDTKIIEKGKEKSVLQINAANPDRNMTKEMKKDAKNLLKMYKKLLKYNDLSRGDDTNKKAKKKTRKKGGTGKL